MINTVNEWSSLRKVLIGSATDANWPVTDSVLSQQFEQHSTHLRGPVSQAVIEEINQDLDSLATALISHGVEVVRPDPLNFQTHDGMHSLCPRRRLLTYGNTVIDPCMPFESTVMEIQCYHDVIKSSPTMTMPKQQGMVLDGANVLKLDENMLVGNAMSSNTLAYQWLCDQLPQVNIERCEFDSHRYLNSTVMPLREGLVMLNASRLGFDWVPKVFDGWHKIWISDAKDFGPYQWPWASKWLALDVLVVDPHTVIINKNQTDLIKILKSYRFEVIPMPLRHSELFGCGFHSISLDLVRQSN